LLIAVLSRLVMEQDKRPFAAVIFRRRSVPPFVLFVGSIIALQQKPMISTALMTATSHVNALVFFLGCATVAGSDAGGGAGAPCCVRSRPQCLQTIAAS